MTRRLGLLALLGWFGASLVVAATPVAAAQGTLMLVSQEFNVAADGAFAPVVELPADLITADLTSAVIEVSVYQKISDRSTVVGNLGGALTRPTDTVVVPRANWVFVASSQIALTVPLESVTVDSSTASSDALSISSSGLFAVQVAIQLSGKTRSSLVTFINRLPSVNDGGTASDPMLIGMAIGTRTSIHVDGNGTTSLEPSAVTEYGKLADTLGAIGTTMPTTIAVAPQALAELQTADPVLFDRLIAALQQHQVAAEPLWPIDPSVAAAAGQQAQYTTWLRDGAAALTAKLENSASRATVLVDYAISADGATLLSNLGAELIVMAPSLYDTLDGSIKQYSDSTGELAAADLTNNDSINVAVIDHAISELLTNPLASPAQTAIVAVAQLLATRARIESLGGVPHRHAVVLGTPDLGVPDAPLTQRVTALIATTPGLAPTGLDKIGLSTDRYISDGQEQRVRLPTVDGAALQRRVFAQASIGNEIEMVASMLPADDPRPAGWRSRVALLPTTALNDADTATMTNEVEGELAALRQAVRVPVVSTVNLSGRRSTVRLRFNNDSDVPLSIKVRLSSPPGKLEFTDNPEPIVLEPHSYREIPFAVVAKSNGTSGVTLETFAPNDAPLGSPVAMQFRVNALGLGNVVTVALVGVVLLWWLQHARSVRRKRRLDPADTLPAS